MTSGLMSFILVSGYDYSRINEKTKKIHGSLNFQQFADRRFELLKSRYPKQELLFFFVDIARGLIRKVLVGPANAKNERPTKPETIMTATAISEKNYPLLRRQDLSIAQRETFCANYEGVLDIMNVYGIVLDLAINWPGTLKEVSFYSHSYWNGPILVNTWRWMRLREVDGGARLIAAERPRPGRDHFFDKEPRGEDDFGDPKVNESLSKAFRPDGVVWIWGCQAAELFIQVVQQASRQTLRSKGLEQELSFRFSREWLRDYAQGDSFFPSRMVDGIELHETSFKKTLEMVLQLIDSTISATYGARLATAWGCETRMAPLGCWSWYRAVDALEKETMGISDDPPNKGNLQFYKKHTQYKFESETNSYLSLRR